MRKTLTILFFLMPFGMMAQNIAWTFSTNDRVYGKVAAQDNYLFAASLDGKVYALDAKTGSLIWSFDTKSAVKADITSTPKGILIANESGRLLHLHQQSGEIIWEYQGKESDPIDVWDYYQAAAFIDNLYVYWNNGGGEIVCLSLESGAVNWKRSTDAIYRSNPVVENDTLYVANYKGQVQALHAANGEPIWQFQAVGTNGFYNAEFQRGVTFHKGVLYIGSRDFNIYAIHAKRGRAVWNRREQGSWIISSPAAWEDKIFYGSSDTHKFYCSHWLSGKTIWEVDIQSRVYATPVVNDGVVYFGTFDGRIYGLDIHTSEQKFLFQTPSSTAHRDFMYEDSGKIKEGFKLYGPDYLEVERNIHEMGSVLSSPVIHQGLLYFGSSDGNIYAVELKNE